ncbi:acyl-CoA synthetase [Acidocella aquatica]|uniref:Acyl-CoA synthetase n=2 Tax=Acidocella aquatica TaxID=1922313 RepID=A0ABQ6A1I1_9PROT|nr:acyl-CoA synthetase [Acidocella aquatica]
MDLSAMVLPQDYPSLFAARTPSRTALIFKDWQWDYAGLDRAANAMVTLFREAGAGPGARVAYIGKNCDLFFIVLFGAYRAGIVLVPVNWRNTAVETRYVLEDSQATLLLADTEFLPMLAEADTRGLTRIVVDADGADGLRAKLAAATPAPRKTLDPHAPSLQLYTSGTTGKPKGVLTSQHAMGAQRLAELVCPAFDDWRDDETLLSPLPSFHIGGMSWVLCGLVRGQSVVITADATPAAILDLIVAHSITRTFIVPTLVRALIEEMNHRGIRAPSLRGIHYGAAAMDAALLERSLENIGCRFLQYYGMTEATGSITLLEPRDHDLSRPRLLRSVGKPLPGITIEIRGPDGTLLNIEQPGEIWVKGPSLFIEYWNRPDATAEVMKDGWYRSGDGGLLNAEGYVFLTDRIKDMIVTGGENVYPAEVEAVLRQHPAVQDCAVFGLPHEKWGEGVTAAVELRPGHTATAEALIAFARVSLAAYKIPRRIEFGVTLPRTAAGKIQRGAVRLSFLAQEGDR